MFNGNCKWSVESFSASTRPVACFVAECVCECACVGGGNVSVCVCPLFGDLLRLVSYFTITPFGAALKMKQGYQFVVNA